MLLVPYLQIRSNSIIAYTLNEDRNFHRSIQALLTENLRKQETYTGKICPGTKKRLIKAIDFMVSINPERKIFNPVAHRNQKFRVGFLTLTIGSRYDRIIEGKEAHKNLLEPFIKWMRQVHGVKSYLWKAELQKRGQIHYHLTIDQFIHWRAIRDKWNELQCRGGYIDSYFKRYGHYDPNSVDIHAVKNMGGLGHYLKKEIAKAFQNEKSIGGKVWDCSLNIKKAKWFTVNENMDYAYTNQMVKDGEMIVRETDHCYIYEFLKQPASVFLNDRYKKDYDGYLNEVRNYDRTVKIKEPEPLPVLPDVIPIALFKRPPTLLDKYLDIRCDVIINRGLFSSS